MRLILIYLRRTLEEITKYDGLNAGDLAPTTNDKEYGNRPTPMAMVCTYYSPPFREAYLLGVNNSLIDSAYLPVLVYFSIDNLAARMSTMEEGRSLHSPPFSGRTPTGLRWTLGIQTGYFSGVPVQEFSGDFPVLVWCLSSMENKSNGLSGRTPDGQSNGLAPKQQPQSGGNQQKVQRTLTGLQPDSNGLSGWTPDGQSNGLHRSCD